MKTFVENVIEICNEIGITRDHIKIEYDKTRHSMIEITLPHHIFNIYETDFEHFNDVMSACAATTVYEVYRNDECVFIGNDMYDLMFYELLKTVLKNV